MADIDPNEIQKAEQLAQVVDLRNKGLSFREIAANQGVSVATAYARLQQAIKEYYAPTQDSIMLLRARSMAACDKALRAALAAIDEGDIDAITPMIKVLDKMQSLHGVEAWNAPAASTLSDDTARAAQNIIAVLMGEMNVIDAEIVEADED